MRPLSGPWREVRRILAVRLDSLGDVLMTGPALRALAAARPPVRITLLTSPAGAPVAGLMPEIDEVIVHEAPWMKGRPRADGTETPADRTADLALVERLAAARFDAAVIFTVHSQSALPAALLCHLAGIPLRLAHARENPYRLLTDWVPDPEPLAPTRHEVRRQLDLVGAVGAVATDEHLSVRVPPEASRDVRAMLDGRGIRLDRPWAVIHPGASAPSRRYPVERFAVVARLLAEEAGWQIVAAGAGPDAPLAEQVVRGIGPGAVALPDRLDIGGLAALLAMAPVLIANNSGPAHLAAAVGTPVVDLYALTNLQHAPWEVPSRVLAHDVPCKGCRKSICPEGHHACLRGVAPEDVVAAALALMAEVRGEPDVATAPPPAGILAAT
jgi:lipopolysaccharide heptosyltransferase II